MKSHLGVRMSRGLPIALLILTVTHLQAEDTPENPYSKETAVTTTSDDGIYQVTLNSDIFPIPLQKIHSWTARIVDTDGKPVENARIRIHGGMPSHRHGFPTKPRVKRYLGDGVYKIDGVKFSMVGPWEMRLNIKEKTRRDRVVFKINLTHSYP